MTKYCKICGGERPFDPTAKPNSKASGFKGAKCWACYLKYHKHWWQKAYHS